MIIIEKFSDGYVGFVLNKVIYVFDSIGSNYKVSREFSRSSNSPYYFIPYKVDENYSDSNKNYHYFVVAFISTSNELYVFYYKYKPEGTTRIEESDYKLTQDRFYFSGSNYNPVYIYNKGLTCEFLKNSTNHDILTCFFTSQKDATYYLSIAYFSINGDNILIYDK